MMDFSVVYFAYIIHFTISLLVGVLYCIGLWISRDGETEKDGNGDDRVVWSMILYPVYKFLLGEKKIEVMYLKSQYEDLNYNLNKWFPELGIDLENKSDAENQELLQKVAKELEHEHSIKFQLYGRTLRIWKDYYEVNWWSKPIIACYKCYASFHGTLIFWLSTLFAVRTELITWDVYILVPMWIIYVFSLVTLNVLLEKKIN